MDGRRIRRSAEKKIVRQFLCRVSRPIILTHYYRDPPSGTILPNHIFTFGKGATATTFHRQEFRNAEKEEFDLLPSTGSSISVHLTAEDRAEDVQNLQHCLKGLPAPGLSAEKANKFEYNMHPFAPTEEANTYYTRMEPYHKDKIAMKKAAKDKTRGDKKK